MALTPTQNPVSNGQAIWDTIKISNIQVISRDIRENRACYKLELDIKDGGESAFETGVFPRWLWLVKYKQGWYVDGLMTGGDPDWWSTETNDLFE